MMRTPNAEIAGIAACGDFLLGSRPEAVAKDAKNDGAMPYLQHSGGRIAGAGGDGERPQLPHLSDDA
jgi:hypothetical protein